MTTGDHVPDAEGRVVHLNAGGPVTNVFVLMLENHSFDHIFVMSGLDGIRVATTKDSNVFVDAEGRSHTGFVKDGAPPSMPKASAGGVGSRWPVFGSPGSSKEMSASATSSRPQPSADNSLVYGFAIGSVPLIAATVPASSSALVLSSRREGSPEPSVRASRVPRHGVLLLVPRATRTVEQPMFGSR